MHIATSAYFIARQPRRGFSASFSATVSHDANAGVLGLFLVSGAAGAVSIVGGNAMNLPGENGGLFSFRSTTSGIEVSFDRDGLGESFSGGESVRTTRTLEVTDGSTTATARIYVTVEREAEEMAAPVISGVSINGTAEPGQVLAATVSWEGEGTLAYQWLRDGVAIVGATASSYTVIGSDDGHALSVSVTATNEAGADMATSAPVTVQDVPPVLTKITISDFPKDKRGNTPVFTSLAAQGKNEGQLPASGTGTAGTKIEARVIDAKGKPISAWSRVATVDSSGKWDAVVKGGTRSLTTRYRVEARAAGATDTVHTGTCFVGETVYVTGQSDLYYAIGSYAGDAGPVTADHDYRVRFIIGTRRGSTPMTDNDLQVINVAGNAPANKGPLWAYANALMRAFPDCPMVIGISAWPGSGLWQVVDDTGDATESNTRLWSDEELTFRQVAPQWQSGRPAVIGLLMEEYTFNFNMGTDKDKVAIPMVFGVDMDGNAFPRGGSVSSDYTGKSYRIDHFMSDLIDFEGGSRFAVTPLNWYEDAVTGNAELAANAHIGQYVSQKHPRPDWNTLVMGRDDGGSWSDLIHFTRASRYGMERRAFLDGLAIAYNFDQWTPPASKLDTIIWPTEEGDDKKVVYLGITGQDIETLARVENITVDDHLGEVAGLIINGEVCTTATIETHDGRKMIAIRKGDGSDWVKADTLEWDPYLTQALDEDAQAAHDVPFGLVQPGVVSSLTGLKIWPIDLTVDAGFFLNQVPAPPASLETEGRSVRLPLSNIHASADQRTYIQIPSYATEAAPIWGGGGALVVSLAMSALFGRNTSLAGYLPAILSIDGGGNTGNSINVVIDNGYTDRLRITIGGTVSVYLDLPNDDRRLLLVIRHDATSGYAELYRDGIQLESVAFAPPAAMVDMGRRDQGHAIGTPRNWWGGANGGLRGWSGEVGFYGYMPGIALTQAHCEAISAGSAPESVVSGWRYAARFNRPDDIELLADTLGVGVPTIIQGENAPAATPGGDITASVSGAARFRLDVIHDGHVWGVAPGETTQKISVSGVASGVTGPVEARYFDADGTIRLDWSELEGVSLTGATDESFEGRTINAGSIGNGWGRVDVRPVNAPALMQRSRTHCGIGYDYTVWGQGDTHSAGSTRSFVTPASTVAAISAARYEGGRALQTVASGALALSEGHAAASHLVADTTTAPVRVVWYTTPGTGPGNLVRDSYTNANLDWPMVEALSAEMNQASTTHIFDFFNVSVNYQPVTSKVLEPFLYGDDNPELPYFSIDHYLYDGVTFPVDAGFTAMEQAPAWVGLGRTDTDWQGPFNRSVDDTLQPGQADTYENTVERYNADADVAAWSAAKGYYFGPSRLDQQGRDGDENHPDPSDTYGAARAGLAQLIAGFRASNLLSRDDARLGQPSLSGAAITIPVLNLHGGTLKTGYAQRGTTPASGWPTVAGFEIRIGSGEWSNGNTVTGRAASEFTAEISGSDVVITRTDAAAWPTNEDIEIRYIGPGGVIYGSRAPVNLRHGLLYAGSPNADDAAYRIEDGHGVLVRPARGLMIEAA